MCIINVSVVFIFYYFEINTFTLVIYYLFYSLIYAVICKASENNLSGHGCYINSYIIVGIGTC